MKNLMTFILCTSSILIACDKPQVETTKTFSKNITGKWNYAQRFYSTGGPLIYESTTSYMQWINFNVDGHISSNTTNYKSFVTYQLLDSFKIKFTSPSQEDRFYFYSIDSLKNSLSLSSADFICIEGCGDIFKK